MQEMMSSLLEHPLFVLFGILAVGLLLGQISVRGISLGSSGVLFAALAAGHFGLQVPEGITGIGTALFVYCVGLGVGNRFFGSLKSQGSRLLLLSVLVVGSAGGLAMLLGRVLGLSAGVTAGLFAGACTSTPGLAAALEAMAALGLPPGAINIGYGVAYPFGVVGVVLFVQLLPRLLKQNLDSADSPNQDPERIVTRVVRIENAGLEGRRILSCMEEGLLQCRVTRILKNDILVPLSADDVFTDGMRVFVVGTLRKVQRDVALLGCIETDVPANHRLMGEMAEVIMLEPAFSNKTLRELDTLGNYGIVISRITRLGNTFVPHGDSEIFRNDVLTIVGQPEDIAAFRKHCRHRSSVINSTDIFSLAAGAALGIAIGSIDLGGGFCLGTAGGPLLVALVLGHFGHIGPVVGYMPRNTRITLMELALMLFLAGAGVSGGATLLATLQAQGLGMFLAGVLITLLPMLLGYVAARRFLGMNLAESLGGICGAMTSTPALGAISARTEKQAPVIAYATAYPVALILMTLLAKLLIMLCVYCSGN